MAIKDGVHLPTKKFRENYDSIFGKKKKTNKDSYGRDVGDKTFDEYWSDEEKLLDLSLDESRRQKAERLKRRNRKDDN